MGARSSNTDRNGHRSQSQNRLLNGHLANFFNSNLNAGSIGPNVSQGPEIQASGGNIDGLEPGNGYKYYVFTSPGTFTLSSVEPTGTNFDFLVVAGGGGGGVQHAAGGGAGGVLYGPSIPLATGSYTVTCGSGGAGAVVTAPGNGTCTYWGNGDDSYMGLPGSPTVQWTATGGGASFSGGRSGNGAPQPLNYGSAPPTASPYQGAGLPGGSGGAGGARNTSTNPQNNPGGTGTQAPMNGATGYGNDGAEYRYPGGAQDYEWGGGGGAGGAGVTGIQPEGPNAKGGPGQPFPAFAGPLFPTMPAPWQSETGPTGLYGGGGGRGGTTGSNQSVGGPGGGGDGGAGPNPGTVGGDGTDGTGGGGGGSGGYGAAGGSGGNGIIMIRHQVV